MHEECTNPVWPCAMTGAVACLAGFSGLGVLIHGSSGCYYYTSALVPVPVHSTFLVEQEVIFGAEERLREVVAEIAANYERIAVVNTCVPSVMGEDLRLFLEEYDVLIVESPGFSGNMETGYHQALDLLEPVVIEERDGVNIDGLNVIDPFCRGNLIEADRLFAVAGLHRAATFCMDQLGAVRKASTITVGTNPDLASGMGTYAGSLLGIENTRNAFLEIERKGEEEIPEAIFHEIDETEERIVRACDRHLRRFDPPVVVVTGNAAYATVVAEMLETYLDAEIAAILTRNSPDPSCPRAEEATSLEVIRNHIGRVHPDLVIGSSYERACAPEAAFFGLVPPLRRRVRLHHPPLIGTEGARFVMEGVLNACIDRRHNQP